MKLGPIRARQVRAGLSSIRKQSEYAYVFHYLRRFQQTEEIAGGKDHTVLPYARLAMFAADFPALSTEPENYWRDGPVSAVRPHEASGSRRAPARPLPFAPDAAASTASPARDTDDHMIIPQG